MGLHFSSLLRVLLTIMAHSTIGAPTQKDSRSATHENREEGTYPCSLY